MTYHHRQTNGNLADQILLAAILREDVRLLARTARAQAAQLEVVDATISGRHADGVRSADLLIMVWRGTCEWEAPRTPQNTLECGGLLCVLWREPLCV